MPARTLHDPAVRQQVLARLDALGSDAQPHWGRMNVGQMLCHLSDALRMALGDLPVASKHVWPFQVFPLKHLVLYVLPFPKGAPTAPELLSTLPSDFAHDRAQLRELIGRFGASPSDTVGRAEHPLFGVLSGQEWGVLQCKHADHHLRQFGV